MAWSTGSRKRLNQLVLAVFRLHGPNNTTLNRSHQEHGNAQDSTRPLRVEAVTQFILTVSDQQLVTALAFLLGSTANQFRLSLYEYSVVAALSWFSSTTHLSTLYVLTPYLRTHKVLRNIRVAGMLVHLGFLLYARWVIQAAVLLSLDGTVPAACLFVEPGLHSKTFWNLSIVISWGPTAVIQTLSFVTVIPPIYFGKSSHAELAFRKSGMLYSYLVCAIQKLIRRPATSYTTMVIEHDASLRLNSIRAIKRKMRKPPSPCNIPRRLHNGFCVAAYRLQDSFLCSFENITTSFCFGIGQLVVTRWSQAPELTSDSVYMGFGQVVSLCLLVIPFFAAAEAYKGIVTGRLVEVSQ